MGCCFLPAPHRLPRQASPCKCNPGVPAAFNTRHKNCPPRSSPDREHTLLTSSTRDYLILTMSTSSNHSLGDACRDGDLEAARRALDQIKTSIAINPQASSIQTQGAQKAALLSAQNGHLSTFLLLHSQFRESILTEDVVRRITENEDRLEFCNSLIKRGWDLNKPYGKKTPLSSVFPTTTWKVTP